MFSKLAKLLFSKILGMWNELQIGLVSYVELTYRLNHKMFLFGNIYAMCSRYQEIKLKLVTALMIKVEISFPFIDGAVSWKNQGKCYKLEISNILFWIEILFAIWKKRQLKIRVISIVEFQAPKGRFFQKVWYIFLIAQKLCQKLSWKWDFEIVFCLESADSNCTAVSEGREIQNTKLRI